VPFFFVELCKCFNDDDDDDDNNNNNHKNENPFLVVSFEHVPDFT